MPASAPPERLVRSRERVLDLGEVFTPRAVVDEMLDLLPAEVWDPDPARVVLEPACGDGNFLVALLERKLARAPAGAGAVLSALGSVHGIDLSPANVRAARGRLLDAVRLNAGEEALEAGRAILRRTVVVADALTWRPPAGVRFDVVVGNPPYQQLDGGVNGSARPLYHRFVRLAKELDPAHVVMVIPSRWMAGGKGLDAFRAEMLGDRRLRALVDFHDAAALFPTLNVNGGVCVVHRDRDHDGPCAMTSAYKWGRRSTVLRDLAEHDVLVRFNEALPILAKVRAAGEPTFDARVSPVRPFGFRTYFRGRPGEPPPGALRLQARAPAWVRRNEVGVNASWIDRWKVLVPAASDGNEIFPLPVLTAPVVAPPGTVCTETYLVLGPFDDEQQARSCAAYVRTRFFRFLLALRKMTQHNRRDRFSFIPDVPLDRAWTDDELYARYGITEDEQATIAELIRAPR